MSDLKNDLKNLEALRVAVAKVVLKLRKCADNLDAEDAEKSYNVKVTLANLNVMFENFKEVLTKFGSNKRYVLQSYARFVGAVDNIYSVYYCFDGIEDLYLTSTELIDYATDIVLALLSLS